MKKSFGSYKKILKEPDSVEHGYNYACFLLGLSMRTQGEIERKMKQRGYNPEVVEEVVARLIKEKVINDTEYAEMYIRSLATYRNYGFYGIKKKMMERWLPSQLIDSALEEFFPLSEELKVAKKFVTKEMGKRTGGTYLEKQKIARKLQTRGFRGDVVHKALSKYSFREDA